MVPDGEELLPCVVHKKPRAGLAQDIFCATQGLWDRNVTLLSHGAEPRVPLKALVKMGLSLEMYNRAVSPRPGLL